MTSYDESRVTSERAAASRTLIALYITCKSVVPVINSVRFRDTRVCSEVPCFLAVTYVRGAGFRGTRVRRAFPRARCSVNPEPAALEICSIRS